MSEFCKHSWFQYWHHFVYTTLLITHYSSFITHCQQDHWRTQAALYQAQLCVPVEVGEVIARR
jgi:hypothetical protein